MGSVSCSQRNNMVTYEEVKSTLHQPHMYLIDVRDPDELAATGEIPSSINIPLPELKAALLQPTEHFHQKYGREKPAEDSFIIFTCRSGRRARNAMEMAHKHGYTRSKTYHGSWLEWAEKEGL